MKEKLKSLPFILRPPAFTLRLYAERRAGSPNYPARLSLSPTCCVGQDRRSPLPSALHTLVVAEHDAVAQHNPVAQYNPVTQHNAVA